MTVPGQAALRRGFDALARAVQAAVVALALAMLGSLALQVVMRFVVNRALSWSEEFALACFAWCMLLAVALGVRDAVHVRMDLLVDRLPAPLAAWAERGVALAIAAFGAFVAWAGVRYVDDSAGTTSAAIGFPVGWLYAAAPVAGALIAAFALERALLGARPAKAEAR